MYDIKVLEEDSKSDIAFEVEAETIEELFEGAATATMNVMVDLNSVKEEKEWLIELNSSNLEMLLFDFLSELVFLKDTEEAIFKKFKITIEEKDSEYILKAKILGEYINRESHYLLTDVKAVTLFHFTVKQLENGNWYCYVLLDL